MNKSEFYFLQRKLGFPSLEAPILPRGERVQVTSFKFKNVLFFPPQKFSFLLFSFPNAIVVSRDDANAEQIEGSAY